MAMSTKAWTELKDGWGLQEVPHALAKDLICFCCGRPWPGKLYTDKPLPSSANLRRYQQECEDLIHSCYCRHHAEQMFKEVE